MFFLAAVGAPALRRVEGDELRARLFREIGIRFRRAGWIAIATLLVTGVLMLQMRGLLRPEVLSDPAFRSSALGRALGAKLLTVVLILVLQALHDFVVGPRAARAAPGSPAALRLRRRSAWLARAAAVVGVALVVAAVRLARGG